ncbi:hypothetical protein PFICI_04509 [Pestalotiopsis fici W106-1]|uniref:Uncharacterized protein n=1 Tax=Pestalotiopsis fici (strain W106-1 / CGMCC3.15140) TaxID=1229662 RepID=W3X934_PESFW|nr:uncharacterized protein PFICI_04509 [Pestalotiopsis fici W106-1]ETS82633.1 hypothetical protein PFICI_04509 [Pestalotiopsis fici W106-1]
MENKTSRKHGTSTDISEYISYYTAHSRENVAPATQHVENIKPSLQNADARYGGNHHVSEQQEIESPSSGPKPSSSFKKSYNLPLPNTSLVQFDTTPFSSPHNKNINVYSPSPSSIYPSEGIRSEDCLSSPELASVNRRGKDFILSDLAQYCYNSSEGRDRTSELRSTSLTDHDGPHVRNVNTNLQEELLAADDRWCVRDVNTSGQDADGSSEGSTTDISTGTTVRSGGELMLPKQPACEEWDCVTANRVVLHCNFVDTNRANSASGIVCNSDGVAAGEAKSGHNKFHLRKWMKRTWGRTRGRLLQKESHRKVDKS